MGSGPGGQGVTRGREVLILGGLLLLFLIRAGTYSTLVPFNGFPDELAHLTQIRMAQYWPLIQEGRTDPARVTRETVAGYKAAAGSFPKPPPRLGGVLSGSVPDPERRSLYYRSLGLLMRWLRVDDPLTAWRLARRVSILAGLAVVVLAWLTARRIFSERMEPALMTAGFTALLPQFGAMSGAVNPDVTAVLFGAVFFYFTARAWKEGPERTVLILGAVLLLTLPFVKKTAFFTLPLFLVLGGAWLKSRMKNPYGFYLILAGVLVLLLTLGTLTAVYPPLAELFVSLFGLPLVRSWGPGFDPLLFRQEGIVDLLLQELRLLDPLFWLHLKSLTLVFFKSFWAYFGYLEAPLAWWWYAGAGVLCLAGGCGWVLLLVTSGRAGESRIMAFMALGVFCSLAFIFLRQVVFSPGSLAQGRHLFPALVPLALGVSAGLIRISPPRAGAWPLAGVLVFLWLMDLKALFGVALPWFYRLYL